MRKRRPSRASRWESAVSDARQAIEEMQSAAGNLDLDGINTASNNLSTAMQDLADVRDEYQEWYDNMPENLRYNSPAGEKLETICNLDITDEIDLDIEQVVQDAIDEATQDIVNVLDEAEGAELPQGFGRD